MTSNSMLLSFMPWQCEQVIASLPDIFIRILLKVTFSIIVSLFPLITQGKRLLIRISENDISAIRDNFMPSSTAILIGYSLHLMITFENEISLTSAVIPFSSK